MPELNPQRFQSLFEHSSDAMVITNARRMIMEVNSAFCHMFGCDAADIIGGSIKDIFASASDYSSLEALANSGDTKNGGRLSQATFLRRDGRSFPAEASLIELDDVDGDELGIAWIIRDLTEFGSTDAETGEQLNDMRLHVALLETLYRETPAMLHSIGPDGRLLEVSQQWLDRLGFERHEVLGRPSTDFLSDESKLYARERVLPEFWKTGRAHRVPYTFVRKDGGFAEIELSAILDTSVGTPRTLAVLEDVTDRNTAVRELERRNEDLSNFAHVAAHDMQTPLRHIQAFGEICAEEIEAGNYAAAQDYLGTVLTSSERLSSLIDSLLSYSEAGQLGLNLCDTRLDDLVHNAITMRSGDISERQANVAVGELPNARCDPDLMGQVMSHLLDNALTYVAPGKSPEVVITADEVDRTMVLRVADNGIGIPPEFWDRIFLPMRRLHGRDAEYVGNGIGLALCKRVVEAHGGAIKVERSGDAGSVFAVSLPRGRL